jgi:hypothetical protein
MTDFCGIHPPLKGVVPLCALVTSLSVGLRAVFVRSTQGNN